MNESGLSIKRLGVPVSDSSSELWFPNGILQNVVFTNKITPNFNETTVFGRNDPIVTYKNTTRIINFSFTIVSNTESIKYINFLSSLVYPLYDDANVVMGTPIFKLRYNNLIYDGNTQDGLIGVIKDLDVGEKFEYGRVLMAGGAAAGAVGVSTVPSLSNANGINNDSGIINYASMKVAFNFIPLHNKPVGFKSDGTFSVAGNAFPFKVK